MASDYIQAWVKLRELRNEWLNKTSEYDAVILPTSQILPPNVELLKNDGDYYKKNNKVENLKWADKDSMYAHQQKNPTVIKAREKQARYKPQTGHKLSSTDVMRIKKKIWDPRRKTRLKLIASQFDISEMQLYRIKSGENWSHVRVPNEPESTRQKSKVY